MDLIEDIGPILGIVAFLGFAILALLIVLQAREVRRLREWAGRAPERAVAADEAALAASEEKGEVTKPERPSRIAAFRERISGAVGPRWDNLNRRSPVDPRLILAAIVGVVVAAVITSGFGLLGDDAGDPEATVAEPQSDTGEDPAAIEVAVLNATQQEGVADPVPGIANLVANQIVKPADFKVGVKADALNGEEDSVVMFEPEAEDDAEALAAAVEDDLGETPVEPMTAAVRTQVEGATIALLVGVDDAGLIDQAAP